MSNIACTRAAGSLWVRATGGWTRSTSITQRWTTLASECPEHCRTRRAPCCDSRNALPSLRSWLAICTLNLGLSLYIIFLNLPHNRMEIAHTVASVNPECNSFVLALVVWGCTSHLVYMWLTCGWFHAGGSMPGFGWASLVMIAMSCGLHTLLRVGGGDCHNTSVPTPSSCPLWLAAHCILHATSS